MLHYCGQVFKFCYLRIVSLVVSYLIFEIFTLTLLYLLINRKRVYINDPKYFVQVLFFACLQECTFCSVEAWTTMILFKIYLLHIQWNVYIWDLLRNKYSCWVISIYMLLCCVSFQIIIFYLPNMTCLLSASSNLIYWFFYHSKMYKFVC